MALLEQLSVGFILSKPEMAGFGAEQDLLGTLETANIWQATASPAPIC